MNDEGWWDYAGKRGMNMDEQEAKRLLVKYLEFEATLLAALKTLHANVDFTKE